MHKSFETNEKALEIHRHLHINKDCLCFDAKLPESTKFTNLGKFLHYIFPFTSYKFGNITAFEQFLASSEKVKS